MTQVGDILRITSCQSLFGQEVCNIFYYAVAIWTGNLTLEDVIDTFDAMVSAPMSQIQSQELAYDLYKIDNITDNLEFDQKSVTRFGLLTESPALPSYVSFGITLGRSNKSTRNGGKRVAGVIESAVTDNEEVLSQAYKDAVTDAFTSNLSDGDPATDFDLVPVIVGRNPDGSYDLTRINPVADASFSPYVTTQNSRKQRSS